MEAGVRLLDRLAPQQREQLARLLPRLLPFADAASADLPLPRLLRLSLFQVSVGLAMALMVGTLNRAMIVELHMAAWLVALMVALPILAAPFRAFVGFRSDTHASAIGWRRVPYVWIGTMLQFGGLAIMPFALLVLTGDGQLGMAWAGQLAAGLAFLLVGAGLQTTQTTGLALATDLASEDSRPRVVALMYVMLLLGMVGGGTLCSALLADFSDKRLVQVVQGAAMLSLLLNLVAVWRQEARNPARRRSKAEPAPAFGPMWRGFIAQKQARRFLWTVALGTMAFNMQDIVLEPYGGEILKLSVGATSGVGGVKVTSLWPPQADSTIAAASRRDSSACGRNPAGGCGANMGFRVGRGLRQCMRIPARTAKPAPATRRGPTWRSSTPWHRACTVSSSPRGFASEALPSPCRAPGPDPRKA